MGNVFFSVALMKVNMTNLPSSQFTGIALKSLLARTLKNQLFLGRNDLFLWPGARVWPSAWPSGSARSTAFQPGDRVGLIWLKNCPEFIFALFGIMLAEGVVVSINSFLTPDEVGFILGDCEAKVLISEAAMAEGTAKLRERLPQLDVIEVESLGQGTGSAERLFCARSSAGDLALIIYTSGTTGKPKGAMLSHQNLMCNVAAVMEAVDIRPDDHVAVLLPMFHSFTMTVGLLLPMTQGVSIIAIKSLHPPKNIIAEIMQHGDRHARNPAALPGAGKR